MNVKMNAHSSGHHSSSLLNTGISKSHSKKSKNDTLRAAIGVLLKQKNIVGCEKFRKSDLLLLQSKEGFVLQKMMESDLRTCNAFLYSNAICLANNSHLVDQQFGKLNQFVELQNEEIRNELRRFYAPILCHLYILLIKAGESETAIEFLHKYAHHIAPIEACDESHGCNNTDDEDSYCQQFHIHFVREYAKDHPELDFFMQLIEKLSRCHQLEALEADADIMHFLSYKYELHTSEKIIQALLQFLERHGHVLILNIILNWFHLHILENEVETLTEESIFMRLNSEQGDNIDEFSEREDQKLKHKSPIVTSSLDQSREESDDVENMKSNDSNFQMKHSMSVLKNYREVLKSSVDIPRIIVVSDKSQGLSTAVLDGNECHLVAGFNSSLIQLWQMNQKFIEGRNIYERHSNTYCRWRSSCLQPEDTDIDTEIDSTKVKPRTEHKQYQQNYYERKYEDNSYNCFGGITLRGHSQGITGVKFSAHHSVLYSTSKDASMRCWRADSLACAAIYSGHRYPIWCMDESPTGLYLATGSKDQTARLWATDREYPLITYIGHTQDVESLAFHPNGNYIATASTDASVRLWCVSSGKLMRVFCDCKQPVCSVAFSPDGKLLAVAGEETKVRVFDIAACSQLYEVKDCSASVISWSPNGQYLVAACHDNSLQILDVKKLTCSTSESSCGTSSSVPSSSHVRVLNTRCKRLVNAYFSPNNTITCIGC